MEECSHRTEQGVVCYSEVVTNGINLNKGCGFRGKMVDDNTPPSLKTQESLAQYVNALHTELEGDIQENSTKEPVLDLILDQQKYIRGNLPEKVTWPRLRESISRYRKALEGILGSLNNEEKLYLIQGYDKNIREMAESEDRETVDSFVREQQNYVSQLFLSKNLKDASTIKVLTNYLSFLSGFYRKRSLELRDWDSASAAKKANAYEYSAITMESILDMYK